MQKTSYNKYIDDCRALGKYIFQGLTNAQIAHKMHCSKSTVSNRICCLFEKYQVKTRMGFSVAILKEVISKYQQELDEANSDIVRLENEILKLKKIIDKYNK